MSRLTKNGFFIASLLRMTLDTTLVKRQGEGRRGTGDAGTGENGERRLPLTAMEKRRTKDRGEVVDGIIVRLAERKDVPARPRLVGCGGCGLGHDFYPALPHHLHEALVEFGAITGVGESEGFFDIFSPFENVEAEFILAGELFQKVEQPAQPGEIARLVLGLGHADDQALRMPV